MCICSMLTCSCSPSLSPLYIFLFGFFYFGLSCWYNVIISSMYPRFFRYEMLSLEEQLDIAHQIGTTRKQIMSNLNDLTLSTSFLWGTTGQSVAQLSVVSFGVNCKISDDELPPSATLFLFKCLEDISCKMRYMYHKRAFMINCVQYRSWWIFNIEFLILCTHVIFSFKVI